MKRIGFVLSRKENENRRALHIDDIKKIKNKNMLVFQKGYGEGLGFTDEQLEGLGCKTADFNEVLKCDIICDPKIGDADYLDSLHNQTIFGWVHAVQNYNTTQLLIDSSITAYAWEDMFDRGRHIFWRNNEIAGEGAVLHAFQCFGVMPYNTKTALIGRGNVANGALRMLTLLGSDVTIYSRKEEKLFREEFDQYDVIVNAVLWDTSRKDHLLYKDDLKRMKPYSMIIDVSCDRNGGIETSVPTTIENPTYSVDGILHYVVDHVPSLYYKTVSKELSAEVCKYVDLLVEEKENEVLTNAKVIENGKIIDKRINEFQNRR